MPLTEYAPIAFIPTSNPAAARAFYETTLGLTFLTDDEFALVFEVGPAFYFGLTHMRLRVVRVQQPFTPAPYTIFGWEVPDIQAAVADLASRGVTFLRFPHFEQTSDGIWVAPDGSQVAWFKDPDGNTLSLSTHPA